MAVRAKNSGAVKDRLTGGYSIVCLKSGCGHRVGVVAWIYRLGGLISWKRAGKEVETDPKFCIRIAVVLLHFPLSHAVTPVVRVAAVELHRL